MVRCVLCYETTPSRVFVDLYRGTGKVNKINETLLGKYRGNIAAKPFCCPTRLAMAKSYRLKYYEDYCDAHGVTDFSVKTAGCAICTGAPLPGRSAARRQGKASFMAECPDHDFVPHSTQTGKCLTCYTTAGTTRLRPYPTLHPERFEARMAGARLFAGKCAKCGPSDHWVSSGLCATCWTANRRFRVTPPRTARPPRQAARLEGKAFYQADCPTHGTTPHWVSCGRCATCCTASGSPRRPTARSARAAARAAGERQYEGRCATHGVTPHGVGSGKCLTCFNSLGYPRPLTPR